MDSRMGRYNSNVRNRAFNIALNGSNLPPANMPANGTLSMIDLNVPYVPDDTEEDVYNLNERSNYSRAGTSMSRTSRTVSDSVSSDRNTSLIPSETLPNNARSSLQTQNLWHDPTASSSQTTYFSGASRINLMENSTHLAFGEQYTNFHRGSPSTSRNQSNAFIQSSITHMIMSDLPEPGVRYQSNVVIQPSSGPARYLRANEVGDTRTAANFLRNNIDSPQLPLVIGESTIAADNRERLLSAGGSLREPGHRDDPIVIEDDDEDEHGDAQQGVIFYDGDMSYEALLALQERIGDVGTGLKKKVISELLKQCKYQSTKMNDCSDNCCVCLGTYGDGDELGKIDCGHAFHYHCIRKWLKIKNSCPICKRTALTP